MGIKRIEKLNKTFLEIFFPQECVLSPVILEFRHPHVNNLVIGYDRGCRAATQGCRNRSVCDTFLITSQPSLRK